eukprot:1851910-Rhodomonas_salina.1
MRVYVWFLSDFNLRLFRAHIGGCVLLANATLSGMRHGRIFVAAAILLVCVLICARAAQGGEDRRKLTALYYMNPK